MAAYFSTAWQLTKQTFFEWQEDKVSRLSASLTYYTLFSLAPLLLIAIAVVGFIFGPAQARSQVEQQVRTQIGEQGAHAVQVMLQNAGRHGAGIAATIVGLVLVLYGATNAFTEMQDAMDTIWEVKPRPGLGIWQTIRSRFMSFAMVLLIGLLLMGSMVLSTVIGVANRFIGGQAWIWEAVNFLASMTVFTVLFAMIFKFLPDVKIRWRDVWIGAIITAVLFTIGKFLIGLYLSHGTAASVYGAAGSLVALLLWVYYSSQILYLGAEFTQVYVHWRGRTILPAQNAIALTEDQRAQLGIPHQQTAPSFASGRPSVSAPQAHEEGDVVKPDAARISRMAMLLAGAAVTGEAIRLLRSRQRPATGYAERRLVPATASKLHEEAMQHLKPEDRKRITALEQQRAEAAKDYAAKTNAKEILNAKFSNLAPSPNRAIASRPSVLLVPSPLGEG